MIPFLSITTLKYILLFSLWVDYLWEQYLCARQYKKTIVMVEQPMILKSAMTKKAYDKARRYMLKRKRFAFIKDLFSITTSTVIILYNILPMVWAHVTSYYHLDEILQNCLWYLTFTTALAILNLPLTLYDIFVIETSKRNELLAWQKFKTFIWSQIFLMGISSVLVLVIQKGDEVFIGLWIAISTLIFLVGTTYPLMGPSRFRQLAPLPEGELRNQIFDLAADLHFPLKQIYVEERFKRSFSQNIYFYGNSNEKNIVLSEQLLTKEEGDSCSDEEVLALIVYEFAHWYYNQAFKHVIALEVNITFYFAAFYILFKSPHIYEIFGFVEVRPILVGVYVVLKYVMALYSTILSFFFLQVSRWFVTQNDKLVVRMGKGEELVSAVVRLEKNSSSFPVYDRLYSVWHHDKPPLLERIANIKDDVNFKFD